MYNNYKQTIITHNDDGTHTAKHYGVQVFPMTDSQGAEVNPPMTGANVEPTVTDATVLASFVSAAQASAQAIATRDDVRVRLNGSATEYTKPA